jgi:signal peptidase
MEPSIMTGDMIVIKKESTYQKNDVITFKDFNDRTVTHRIIEAKAESATSSEVRGSNNQNSQIFVTKGDANQATDTGTLPQERVIGKVVQVIPKFGYVVQFIKSPWGFILCIIAPAILIIYDEVRAVFEEARPVRRRRQLPH